MSKKCSKCGEIKDLSEFYIRKKHRKGEYYERCKDCFKERGRNYYHANHERQLSLALKRKARYKEERRQWLNAIKNKPCVDCGGTYPPYVMDFDHRDADLKVDSISRLSLWSTTTFEKIKAEIEKCDLICANCHRKRTHDRILKQKNASLANVVKAAV